MAEPPALHDVLGEIATAAGLTAATLHRLDEPGTGEAIAACRRIVELAALHRTGADLAAAYVRQAQAWLAQPCFSTDASGADARRLHGLVQLMRSDAQAAGRSLAKALEAIAGQDQEPMPAMTGPPLLELSIPLAGAAADDVLATVDVYPARLAIDLGDGVLPLPDAEPAGAVVLVSASPLLELGEIPPAWAAEGWAPDHARVSRSMRWEDARHLAETIAASDPARPPHGLLPIEIPPGL